MDVEGLLDGLTAEQVARLAEEVADDPKLRAALDAALDARLAWKPLPHQVAPAWHWATWVLFGGRGTGKTDGGSQAVLAHIAGPPCDLRAPGGHRLRIVAPTFGDGVASCVNGVSGLRAHDPTAELVGTKEGTIVRWPSGAVARIFGAHTPSDADRFRAGGNSCFDWYEELAAWRQLDAVWDQARFGLRLGPWPRAIITTTPKNRPVIRDLLRTATARATLQTLGVDVPDVRRYAVALTVGSTLDNPHLDASVREELLATYGGTRLGRQELFGEVVEDVGEMFSSSWFEYRDGWPDGGVAIRCWDFAATQATPSNPDPDWTVGLRCSFDQRTRVYNVDDIVRVQGSPAEVEALFVRTALADGPQVRQVIEQEPGSSGKAMATHYRALIAGRVPCSAFLPSGSKEVRAQLPAIAAEQGRITLTRGSWNRPFLDELEEFPLGAHDDQVDALSGAVTWLEGKARPASTSSAATIASGRLPRPGRR